MANYLAVMPILECILTALPVAEGTSVGMLEAGRPEWQYLLSARVCVHRDECTNQACL